MRLLPLPQSSFTCLGGGHQALIPVGRLENQQPSFGAFHLYSVMALGDFLRTLAFLTQRERGEEMNKMGGVRTVFSGYTSLL